MTDTEEYVMTDTEEYAMTDTGICHDRYRAMS